MYSGVTQPKGLYDVKQKLADELIKQSVWTYANLVEEKDEEVAEVIVEKVKEVKEEIVEVSKPKKKY